MLFVSVKVEMVELVVFVKLVNYLGDYYVIIIKLFYLYIIKNLDLVLKVNIEYMVIVII